MTHSKQLAALLTDPDAVKGVRADEIPALLGELEELRSRLWAKLTTPTANIQTSESASNKPLETRNFRGSTDPLSGEHLLTIQEASEYLNMPAGTLRRWVEKGLIRSIKLGNHVRIDSQVLREFVESGRR